MSRETPLQNAISILTEALGKDKTEGSYYYSWQANIAMAFYDEYIAEFGYSEKMAVFIREVANNAAKRFLDSLLNTEQNVQVSDATEADSKGNDGKQNHSQQDKQ